MKTKTEIERCEECDGIGWLAVCESAGGGYLMTEKAERGFEYTDVDGCSKCGGSGEMRY